MIGSALGAEARRRALRMSPLAIVQLTCFNLPFGACFMHGIVVWLYQQGFL